ncbi:60S ribosomal protein L22e [Capsaspora owczarzaki ATCC 30864]|uniref:Large ribosomal subunit protein eL22 n=1 Tax=Capsaspora owczarzaki (strain ATCC 30864) TaxID=595528 RepID=A0A0D2U2R6_CAPO3|nr:60S ribosomal protein L22e [Capsaspora owczarzaki ATCC 30864]KJE89481.1 60S ribosomal protein L22e [Capsaspora owczarzaki ATCC 30864]|eukprot:XP_004365814.1 60S ribosomal protein L22e [Capsaspora owczarzaki ATCC 30864]
MSAAAASTPVAASAAAPKVKTVAPKRIGKVQKKKPQRFIVDCSHPVEDAIIKIAELEKFFHDRIKVEGKINNLGRHIAITTDASKVTVTANDIPLSKRYLKYLTNKFLKKSQLRDYLHVVSTSPTTYELRYFKIAADEEADE